MQAVLPCERLASTGSLTVPVSPEELASVALCSDVISMDAFRVEAKSEQALPRPLVARTFTPVFDRPRSSYPCPRTRVVPAALPWSPGWRLAGPDVSS